MNVRVIPNYIGGREIDHNRSKLSSIKTMKGRCPFMEMGAETLQRHRGLEGGISHMQLGSPTISRVVNLNEGWHVDFLSRSFLVLTACRCFHFVNCQINRLLVTWFLKNQFPVGEQKLDWLYRDAVFVSRKLCRPKPNLGRECPHSCHALWDMSGIWAMFYCLSYGLRNHREGISSFNLWW